MTEITSYAMLETIMKQLIAQAMDNLADRLLEKLQTIMLDEIYGSPEGDFYHRTMEMLDSFEKSKAIVKGNLLESDIFQAWEAMTFDADNFTHGSNISGDFREHLASVINFGAESSLFGRVQSRPFWDKFIEWLNGNINILFKEELAKVEINVDVNLLAMWS